VQIRTLSLLARSALLGRKGLPSQVLSLDWSVVDVTQGNLADASRRKLAQKGL
jgi:hypothetical protein